MKLFLKKNICFLLLLLITACGQSVGVVRRTPDCERFLKELGWECGVLVEMAEVDLPAEGEAVYKEYNALQLENGYDLKGFGGRRVTRYTYEIKNHPRAQGRQVLANILINEDKIIGGDIMVTAIDGFMHGLCPYPGG